MSQKPVYVVSDIHLGAVPRETERAFRAFLGRVGEAAQSLLINGDLFDFWFEYRSVVMREHYRVLARLAELVEAGVKVWLVGGNHDAWGGSFLRDEVGIELLQGPLVMDLAGRRTLVAHGDGVGGGDFRYRALKAVVRSPGAAFAFRRLHPDLGQRIAARASRTHQKAEGLPPSRRRAEHIQRWAEEQLRADPSLRLVLAGHAHLSTRVEVEPGRFYVNSGDWLERFEYVILPPDGGPPQLRDWAEEPAGAPRG
jgi:UDP-2,3-diacylglucosamine hydrolase